MQNRRTVKWMLLASLAAAVVFVSTYGPSVFATKTHEEVSPLGYYRLGYFRPGFPYMFSLTKQAPRFVRLYDNRTGEELGESKIVEMNGGLGEVFWASKDDPNIRVGMNIVFPASPEVE